MNWEGLVLSAKEIPELFFLVLSTPFPSENPKIAVAIAHRYRGDPDDESDGEIILCSDDWPGPGFGLCIQQAQINLSTPQMVENRINPRIYNQVSIVGNLDGHILHKLREQLSRSRHVNGAVKEHLKAWLSF